MVWYGNFIYTRYFLQVDLLSKTNDLTKLGSKKKTKITRMKRKHLLFKEAVCKNKVLLIKLFHCRN